MLQVIQHVAERLSDLHQAGYVHRDLKQSNVMWLPRENRWTLIDFGCAARIGEYAPLSYSLSYAPPEVIQAVRGSRRTIVADTAMDAWALGIVAVELFTNQPTFSRLEDREKVTRMPTCLLTSLSVLGCAWGRGREGFSGTAASRLHWSRATTQQFLRQVLAYAITCPPAS